MEITRFEPFQRECSEKLPREIGKILRAARGRKSCAIGLITTDDFYGFYMIWTGDYNGDIEDFEEWPDEDTSFLDTDFLYQPLVDIVDACQDVDLCRASDEKWDFALTLLAVLEQCIRQTPDEVFQKNGFQRDDVLFFATMGDGDYIYEMLHESLRRFNSREALAAHGLPQ